MPPPWRIDTPDKNSKVKIVDSKDLRKKFLKFFEKRGHRIIPSSSLLPSDYTVLLTTAGMQQFTPYLSGEKNVLDDFGTRHLASVQKCFRTLDIEEVGDDTHHTFFEMLGNWSIGEDKEKGYFKEGAIDFALEFLCRELGLSKDRMYVTVFGGGNGIPCDDEVIRIWKDRGVPESRIKVEGATDNFWGPVVNSGPCGPCSEIHYDRGEKYGCGKNCGVNCKNCDRFVEVWCLVFMEYWKDEDNNYKKMPQRNVDTGIGFERLAAILQNGDTAYETDLFYPAIKRMEEITERKYEEEKESFRIVADHVRGSVFLIADGVLPSNKEEGYVLRRVIRRAIRYGRNINLDSLCLPAEFFIGQYREVYPELGNADILAVIRREEERFIKTLKEGLKELDKLKAKKGKAKENKPEKVSGKDAFYLYQTFGFPVEMIKEELSKEGLSIEEAEFKKEFYKHQKVSKKGAEKKFGGMAREAGEREIKLHRATHLLHQALRKVLGDHVRQMGSDINKERLRFDFSHPRKLTSEEIEEVEKMVNEKIKEDLPIREEKMRLEEAKKKEALAFFEGKYTEVVDVYSIGDFSLEVCGGPHVRKTGELGKFSIIKEEASSAGVRRIKATIST